MAYPLSLCKTLIVLIIFVGSLALFWIASPPNATGIPALAPIHRQPLAITAPFPTLQGKLLDLTELRGQVVLVNFWATWCYPCRMEMPSMSALYQRYQNKPFTIIAIASDTQGIDVVAPFVSVSEVQFPIGLDPQNHLGKQLKIPGLPTSYILDTQGRVASLVVGARDWNSKAVHQLLDTLLAEAPRKYPDESHYSH